MFKHASSVNLLCIGGEATLIGPGEQTARPYIFGLVGQYGLGISHG